MKSNSSSSGEWLNASSKSAAPSAPWVSSLKHLQCFVSIDLSQKHLETAISQLGLIRQLHKSHNASEFEQLQTEKNARGRKQENLQHHPSTISLCEAPIEICLLQVKPLGTMKFLPRCCWDPMTELKIQGNQVAALQSREEIQSTTFFAMLFRKDVDQMFPGGDWKVHGTPQVHEVSESGRSEVARVDLNGMFAQWSNHGFGHLTTGAKPKTTLHARHLHGRRLPCLRVFCFEGRHKGRKINRTIFFTCQSPNRVDRFFPNSFSYAVLTNIVSCRGGFRTTVSAKVPGQVPGFKEVLGFWGRFRGIVSGTGFRKGSGQGSKEVPGQVPARFPSFRGRVPRQGSGSFWARLPGGSGWVAGGPGKVLDRTTSSSSSTSTRTSTERCNPVRT